MHDASAISREQTRALAEVASLDLSPGRLAALVASLPSYVARIERLRAIHALEREPPAMSYDREAKV